MLQLILFLESWHFQILSLSTFNQEVLMVKFEKLILRQVFLHLKFPTLSHSLLLLAFVLNLIYADKKAFLLLLEIKDMS